MFSQGRGHPLPFFYCCQNQIFGERLPQQVPIFLLAVKMHPSSNEWSTMPWECSPKSGFLFPLSPQETWESQHLLPLPLALPGGHNEPRTTQRAPRDGKPINVCRHHLEVDGCVPSEHSKPKWAPPSLIIFNFSSFYHSSPSVRTIPGSKSRNPPRPPHQQTLSRSILRQHKQGIAPEFIAVTSSEMQVTKPYTFSYCSLKTP